MDCTEPFASASRSRSHPLPGAVRGPSVLGPRLQAVHGGLLTTSFHPHGDEPQRTQGSGEAEEGGLRDLGVRDKKNGWIMMDTPMLLVCSVCPPSSSHHSTSQQSKVASYFADAKPPTPRWPLVTPSIPLAPSRGVGCNPRTPTDQTPPANSAGLGDSSNQTWPVRLRLARISAVWPLQVEWASEWCFTLLALEIICLTKAVGIKTGVGAAKPKRCRAKS